MNNKLNGHRIIHLSSRHQCSVITEIIIYSWTRERNNVITTTICAILGRLTIDSSPSECRAYADSAPYYVKIAEVFLENASTLILKLIDFVFTEKKIDSFI